MLSFCEPVYYSLRYTRDKPHTGPVIGPPKDVLLRSTLNYLDNITKLRTIVHDFPGLGSVIVNKP